MGKLNSILQNLSKILESWLIWGEVSINKYIKKIRFAGKSENS